MKKESSEQETCENKNVVGSCSNKVGAPSLNKPKSLELEKFNKADQKVISEQEARKKSVIGLSSNKVGPLNLESATGELKNAQLQHLSLIHI